MIPFAEVFLLCSVPSLTVGILIYGENPKHVINRLLLLFSVVLFYWGFTQFEYMKANDIQTALFWMRLHAFWYLLPALALDFAIVYTNLRVRRLFRFFFVYGPAVFLSLFETVAISYHPTMMPWGWDYAYSGYFGYVELLWTILPTVLALSILFRRYWSAESQNERIGVGYIFSGFSLPIIMGISTTVLQVLASIDLPDLTAPSAAVGFLLVWYGVVRHGSYILMANAAADDILSTMADALFLVNRTGEVIVVNKAASRLLEYEASELIGRQLSTLTSDPVSLEGLLRDSSTIFENYFKTKQGRTIPVSLSKSSILTKVGDPMGYVIICRDITERKRMEDEVRESERRFREMTDMLPETVFELDANGKLTYLNQTELKMIGYDAEDLKRGLSAFQVIASEDHDALRANIGRILNGGHSPGYEYVMLRKDGSRFPGIAYANPILKGGRAVGLRGVVVDITERKRMEDALRESENRYRRLFESSPVSLWEEDFSGVKKYFDELRGRGVNDFRAYFLKHPEEVARCSGLVKILDVNRTTLALYKAENVSEFLGGLSKFFTKESLDNFREEIVALAEGKTRFESEFFNQTLAGDVKHISLMVSVIPGYENTLGKVLVSIIDLTEYKLMEERLLRSERLAAIGQTAAMVGHDLRNPLQGIAGAAYLLRKQHENPPNGEERPVESGGLEIVNMIEDSVKYMNKIVSDLQSYAAPTHLEPAVVSINQLLNETHSTIRIPANVKVSLNLQDAAQKWLVDPELMKRVFTNLIMNALQAMPQGGELKIATQKTMEETLVSFQDTGTGISETDLPKLFQPFHTTKAQGQGLGLPVCKRLVEAHGGQITVNSTAGKGSTFTVKLSNKPNSEGE